MKLLPPAVIMGVDHSGVRRVGDGKAVFDKSSRVNHILVKNRPAREPALGQIRLPLIHGAHIGTKKSFDPKLRQIRRRLHPALRRVIKGPRIPLQLPAVLPGQLPCVGRLHPPVREGSAQALHQILVRRKGILGQAQQIIRVGKPRRLISGSAMVKFLLIQREHLHFRLPCEHCLHIDAGTCIHNPNPVHRKRLSLQPAKQLQKFLSRAVYRDNHINLHLLLHSRKMDEAHTYPVHFYPALFCTSRYSRICYNLIINLKYGRRRIVILLVKEEAVKLRHVRHQICRYHYHLAVHRSVPAGAWETA